MASHHLRWTLAGMINIASAFMAHSYELKARGSITSTSAFSRPPNINFLEQALGRDLRQFTRQTNRRLIIGFVLLLLIIGDGLILLIYGPGAAVSGLLCLLAGLAPFALLWAILNGLDWLGKRTDQW